MIRHSLIAAALLAPAFGSPVETQPPRPIASFLDLNCYECHNDVDRKGHLDLESLAYDPSNPASLKKWAFIHDRVRDGEMPPPEEFVLSDAERLDFVRVLEQGLHDASVAAQAQNGRVRSRRLNRIEYENTIHDVLGISIPLREHLPEDPANEGFTNLADSQQISYHLLEKYLQIIDLSLDEAFRRVLKPTAPYKLHAPAKDLGVGRKRNPNERQPFYYDDHAVTFASDYGYHGRMPATTVPETGWYRVSVKAKAMNPPDGRNVWTQIQTGIARALAPVMYWVGHFEATSEPQVFTFDAWIQKEHMLEIRPGDRTLKWSSTNALRDTANYPELEVTATGVAVEYVEMERLDPGPALDVQAKNLFGNVEIIDGKLKSQRPKKDLAELVARFAERAFRRPVDAAQIAPYIQFANDELAESKSFQAALKAGYRAVLSSPRFLYFTEARGALDDYAIATRLSYLVWSCPPDERLLASAAAGRLSQPDELKAQLERLLADQRSEAFVNNFTDSWLSLADIDFTTPDTKLYPDFDEVLKQSMLAETRAFFVEMIRQNLSVTNLIDSDFAMLNERLAQHYGIDGVSGSSVHSVDVRDTSGKRGGLITQGSILKVTANGTATSPVIRGVWLQDRILGKHIPPPPDTVAAVEPDIRGAVTIREQLEKHRSEESCMACHKMIDPPGFALESYDATGRWRQAYVLIGENKKRVKGLPVDPSYHFPDGTSFEDIAGFKAFALANPEQIARNAVNKLLTYATGAQIEFADRREIDRIVANLAESDYGFRSLLHASVQSEIFRTK